MKKIFSVLLILFLVTASSHSQQLPKNEFSCSYGVLPVQAFADVFGSVFISTMFFGTDETKTKSSGPVILRYSRHISKNANLGLCFSYAKTHSEVSYSWAPGELSSADSKLYTVMADANVNFINENNISLYSGFCLGISFINRIRNSTGNAPENENLKYIAYHLNALGVRAGNNVGGFVELGFGYNGIINAGLSVKF